MDSIWEELGTKFKDLLGMGRSGVIGSVIATSQRFHTHEHKVCNAFEVCCIATPWAPN